MERRASLENVLLQHLGGSTAEDREQIHNITSYIKRSGRYSWGAVLESQKKLEVCLLEYGSEQSDGIQTQEDNLDELLRLSATRHNLSFWFLREEEGFTLDSAQKSVYDECAFNDSQVLWEAPILRIMK